MTGDDMANSITETIKQIWKHWNVRGAVLCSLCLQILLILFAPYRKRTGKKTIIMLIWSTYLLADAVANFSIGLILNSQRYPLYLSAPEDNSDIFVFWAPFLLIHLGGPDTITAFSLEDNQLWLRHLYTFVVQAVLTGYVFLQTLPTNKLWIPTSLVFVAGFIKYLERTCSLYLASKEKFRDSLLRKPNPGVDYAELMDTFGSKIPDPENRLAARTQTISWDVLFSHVKSKDVQLVCKAYGCFKLLKGLLVDLPPRVTDYEEINRLWQHIEEISALRMIEVELNFFYEVLYTKAVVVHSIWGKVFRLISFISVVAALAAFHFHVKKLGHFNKFDVGVTYALLFGALALDTLALLMAILSDWTLMEVLQIKPNENCCLKLLIVSLFSKFLYLKGPKTYADQTGQIILASPFIFQSWSGYVPGFNFIRYCLKRRPAKIRKVKFQVANRPTITYTIIVKVIRHCRRVAGIAIKKAFGLLKIDKALPYLLNFWDKLVEWVGLRDFLDEMLYKSNQQLTRELWKFMLKELQTKSNKSSKTKSEESSEVICSARGEWVLQNDFQDEDCTELRSYIVDVVFDESLLLWHIATELLYRDKKVYPGDESYPDRKFSKILSDYMLYLLIMRPTMMEAVSSSDQILRFKDTCAEAERFFKNNGIRSTQLKTACKKILGVKMEIAPKELKGEESMSVLFEANMLAKELMRLKEKKWKVLCKVWAEMLSYAACHCRSSAHAQQISKGGELITFVWLAMAHFGLIRKQFQKKR